MSEAMTLRDKFAVAVLPAIYLEVIKEIDWLSLYGTEISVWIKVSRQSYQIADAMLIARQKDNQK